MYRPLMLWEYVRSGYNLDQIAEFTHLPQDYILDVLTNAIRCQKRPRSCNRCPLQLSCDANCERIARLLRHKSKSPRFPQNVHTLNVKNQRTPPAV